VPTKDPNTPPGEAKTLLRQDVAARLETGQVLLGRYLIRRVLGRGGMGEVLECQDQQTGVDYALKRVPPELTCDITQLQNIRANFALVSQLTHPHIATTRYFEIDSAGQVFLLMDLVRGCDLAQWVRTQREAIVKTAGLDPAGVAQMAVPLPMEVVLGIGEQLAQALDYAHSQPIVRAADGSPRLFGILHRDLKPENVMVEAGRDFRLCVPYVRIVDFGLAAEIQASMQSLSMGRLRNEPAGTPQCMAPEQWTGKTLTRGVDQWALAVLLYQLLAGRSPFAGPTPTALMTQICNANPEPPSTLTLIQWAALKKSFNPDRKQRYRSCLALVRALADADRATMGRVVAVETHLPEELPNVLMPTFEHAEAKSAAPKSPVANERRPGIPQASPPDSPTPVRAALRLKWGVGVSAAVLLALLGGGVLAGWYYLKNQFEGHLASARTEHAAKQWDLAREHCRQALAVPGCSNRQEALEELVSTERDEAFEKACLEGQQAMASGIWASSESAFRRALAVPGHEGDTSAKRGLETAINAQAFRNAVTEATNFAVVGNWLGVQKSYETALVVPGYAEDSRAKEGLKKARDAKSFQDALDEATKLLKDQAWGEAEKHCRKALALPDYANDVRANAVLETAQNGLKHIAAIDEASDSLEKEHWGEAEQAAKRALDVVGFRDDTVAEALLQKARNGQSFSQALVAAQLHLDRENWKDAETGFKDASSFADALHSPVLKNTRQKAVNGQSFARIMAEANQLRLDRQWSAAEALRDQAKAVSGYADHVAVQHMYELIANGKKFDEALQAGQDLLNRRQWVEAEKSFQKALDLPGYSEEKRARDGLRLAQDYQSFAATIRDCREYIGACNWIKAREAYGKAQSIKLLDKDDESRQALREAEAELKKHEIQEAYSVALRKANELRAAVPPGERQAEAWAKVKAVAGDALQSGNPDAAAAKKLFDEAATQEQTARKWQESDGLLEDARRFAAKAEWGEADQKAQKALSIVTRKDEEQLLAEIARHVGRSYWQDDLKCLEYKNRKLILGARDTKVQSWPLVGHIRNDKNKQAVFFGVRLAESDMWFVGDAASGTYVLYEVARNEGKNNPQAGERTERVGECVSKPDKRWSVREKIIRQYDKQAGGSGSLYISPYSMKVLPQEDGSVICDMDYWPPISYKWIDREVPDEIAKKAIDAYEIKFTQEAEKEQNSP
jgi:serine/threonine-protein kinase